MAAEFNRVILLGRLTRDPELRYLDSGTAVAKLGIASSRSYNDSQSGERKEEVLFVNVDVWGRLGETCHRYLSKGRLVLIEGRLIYRQWETESGDKRSVHEISANSVQFLDRGDTAEQGTTQNATVSDDDDIPF
ncbi:single-stranded DNA-binding protein [Candidatus Poribacteria bacterium]|nr:single-stranded DNA-binding protein [Candidatus Poribacteria bacterium]